MTQHPIPDDALDDRLAGVGTSGSGKTYNLGTAIERVLELGRRVGIVDPLGVWWGLRLKADGKAASPWPIVIFGGPHGDLPLTENAGQLIGETCAAMAESFIIDLSELGTRAAERRFMLAFYSALYRHATGEPLHLVTDEADMFAPQTVQDKEGGALKLLGVLETIVRRGRVKGFIPWLITQRPAVLNKNVLSQADGLVAMKLTSSQDRGAIGSWIDGQADKADGKRILDSLPSLQLGTGVVWIPSRGILKTADFPRKSTFDSSRTPKRGEVKRTHTLKPINVEAIAGKLATVEAEVAAADPAKLRNRIAELERQLKAAAKAPAAKSADWIAKDLFDRAVAAADREGEARGRQEAEASKRQEIFDAVLSARMTELTQARNGILDVLDRQSAKIQASSNKRPATAKPIEISPVRHPPSKTAKVYPVNGAVVAQPLLDLGGGKALSPYQREIMNAIRFWEAVGFNSPTRVQVAGKAGKSSTSSTFEKYLSILKVAGLVEYPTQGALSLTAAGRDIAVADTTGSVRDAVGSLLSPYQASILDALPRDGAAMRRADIAEAVGVSEKSSTFEKYCSALKSLGLVTYPDRGSLAVETWVWQ